jgi:cytochrome P450
MAPNDIAVREGGGFSDGREVEEAQSAAPAGPPQSLPPFDPKALEPRWSLFGWLPEWVQRHPRFFWGLLRACFRVVYIPFAKWSFVLRMDDVREVLNHDEQFPVRWDRQMKENTNDLNFVLGMRRDATYRRRYKELAEAFPLADVGRLVAQQAAREAREIVDRAASLPAPRLDGVEQLVTEVPARLCKTYYGIDVRDFTLFAKWTLAISAYTFGPTTSKKGTALAAAAAAELTATIRRSIAMARDAHARATPNPDAPVIENMIKMGLDDDEIHAHLFGMVLGFIPTDVLAGGNMLEVLMRYRDFRDKARLAAIADDDELLWKHLREALRFRHINLGAWRGCTGDYRLASARFGGLIRGGQDRKVLAVIPSAMFDARRVDHPNAFDPDRREEDYMIFGVGQHWCLGAYIAKAQLTQTFKPLLKHEGLEAVDKRVRTKRFNGLFPLHLDITFDR